MGKAGGSMHKHVPTEKTRAEVAALVSFGIKQEDIAKHIGICIDTLDKRYREELDTAVTRANAKVAAKLFNKCVEDEDLTAIIFWLKTRARWREKDDLPEETNRVIHEEAMKGKKVFEKDH